MTDKVLIIGGGVRLLNAAEAFRKNGFETFVYDGSEPLKGVVDNSDIILLGLPASKDDVHISECSPPVTLRDIAAMCSSGKKIVFGGMMSERVKALFDVYSVRWADYAKNEGFEIMNAVPTAEGAIRIIMDEFPFTVHSSRIAVTGYGKVAKALAKRLKALGSECIIVARNPHARAEAEADGFISIDFPLLPKLIPKCHILINTVPAMVCTKEVLGNMSPSQGIIDLASKPGGVDLNAAKIFGVNVIWALGLPGKCAPQTAGEIIQKTVCNIMNELRL